MKITNNLKGTAVLGFASLIWGLAFVAQGQAAALIPPFLFNSLRSLVAAFFLWIILLWKDHKTHTPLIPQEPVSRRDFLVGGGLCGILLTVSVNFQQIGIAAYPAGTAAEARSGFITALYVVLVPLFGFFLGKKLHLPVLGAVLLAVGGVYLLSLSDGIDRIYLGDLLVFGCAVSFSFHILTVDHYGDRIEGLRLSMLQFLICGILSGLLSLFTEEPTLAGILSAIPQILYVGIFSSAIGYTLQIYGQRLAEPAIASITMSLESVFAALGGWLINGNTLAPRELAGCALVFLAILLAQLPQLLAGNTKKEA